MSDLLEQRLSTLRSNLEQEIDFDASFISPRPPGPSPDPSSPVIFSDELLYLNQNWNNWSEASPFSSHRPFLGRIIGGLKRRVQRYLFNVLFKDYFDKEREFTMRLVQFCNITAKYIDQRHEQVFWQLVEKLDREINNVNLRNDALFAEIIKNRMLNSVDKS